MSYEQLSQRCCHIQERTFPSGSIGQLMSFDTHTSVGESQDGKIDSMSLDRNCHTWWNLLAQTVENARSADILGNSSQ